MLKNSLEYNNFSVLINGKFVGFFPASWGVKQGDLSPFVVHPYGRGNFSEPQLSVPVGMD